MPNIDKRWTLAKVKSALTIVHNLPLSDSRALETQMYRKSDTTFSEPLPNSMSVFQLDLNPDDRLVFNYKNRVHMDLA
jgi:hypothetical protein